MPATSATGKAIGSELIVFAAHHAKMFAVTAMHITDDISYFI